MKTFEEFFSTITNSLRDITSQEHNSEVMSHFCMLPIDESSYKLKHNSYVNTFSTINKDKKFKFVFKLFEENDKLCFSIDYFVSSAKILRSLKKYETFLYSISKDKEISYSIDFNGRKIKKVNYKFNDDKLVYIKVFAINLQRNISVDTELSLKTENFALGSKSYTTSDSQSQMLTKYDIDMTENPEFSLDLLDSKYARKRAIPKEQQFPAK